MDIKDIHSEEDLLHYINGIIYDYRDKPNGCEDEEWMAHHILELILWAGQRATGGPLPKMEGGRPSADYMKKVLTEIVKTFPDDKHTATVFFTTLIKKKNMPTMTQFSYISSAHRSDMIESLQKWIDDQKRRS